MTSIKVKARKGAIVPTPYGMINDGKWVEVSRDIYIRRRLAEGDLIEKVQERRAAKKTARTKRRTA